MTTPIPPTAGRAKVPVWRTALASYGFVFSNLGRFFALGWLLFLIAVATSSANGIVTEATTGASPSFGERTAFIALNVIYWAVYVIFAVRWHRFFLLSERESVFTDILAARNWRFLGYSLLLSSVSFIPLLVASLLDGESSLATSGSRGLDSDEIALAMLAVLSTIAATILGIIFMRFSLVLPAAAVDRPIGLGYAWRNMRGNSWRFIGATFAVGMPLIIAALIVDAYVGISEFAKQTGSEFEIPINVLVVANAATAVIGFLTVAVWVTVLSTFYRHIVGVAPAGGSVT